MSMGPEYTEDDFMGEIIELKEDRDKAIREMKRWKGRAKKLTLISTNSDERVKKYWLALEKLSYKCRDGWSGDDCADYAGEAIKGFVPENVNAK